MYIFVDCETGGLTPEYSLFSLGVIITDVNFNEIDRHEFLFRLSDIRVTPQALMVNHIDVSQCGFNTDTFHDATAYLYPYEKEKYIFAGWNVQFDMLFVDRYIPSQTRSHRMLDIQSVYRFFYPHNNANLIAASKSLGIALEPNHTAMRDIECTVQIARALKQK